MWDAVQQLENYQSFIPALFNYNAAFIASDGVQARWARARNGSSRCARSVGARTPRPVSPNCRLCSPACSSRPVFSISSGISSCSRIWRRRARKEDRGISPVPRGQCRGRGDIAGGRSGTGGRRGCWNFLRPARVRGHARRQAGRRRLAHAGFGPEPDDGLLCRAAGPAPGHGKPDHRRDHRPQRPRRPALATFARFRDLLRCDPEQTDIRADLRQKLRRCSGGVVFTTIQKFMPEEKGNGHPVLSERRSTVIADKAHRSQYDFIDGLARYLHDALPHASFIGFTGTPIEKTDANTRAVFGDYISIYDIQRAVTDGATVPIYYESRLAKLELKPSERPKIDPEFEELTEGEEIERKQKPKTKWGRPQLEALRQLRYARQASSPGTWSRIAAAARCAWRRPASRHLWAHVIAWSANAVPARPLASAPISPKSRCAPRAEQGLRSRQQLGAKDRTPFLPGLRFHGALVCEICPGAYRHRLWRVR